MREGHEVIKTYTFVSSHACLAICAIHEWVKNLSIGQFLFCLRRYIQREVCSRRKKPQLIISDSAPQFKTAEALHNRRRN